MVNEKLAVVAVVGLALAYYVNKKTTQTNTTLSSAETRYRSAVQTSTTDPSIPRYNVLSTHNQLMGNLSGAKVFKTNPYTMYARTRDGDIVETSPVQIAFTGLPSST